MDWHKILEFFNNISQAGNQMNRTTNAIETQKDLENSEINISSKGNSFDVKFKNVPKGLFAGINPLQRGEIASLYNLKSPDLSKLSPYEQAELKATMELTPPEKPSGSILSMIKNIPLGGYKFDPRLGWGNVVNALSSFAIGQQIIKQDYEEKRRRYELDRQNLTKQIINEEISIGEYLDRQKKLNEQINLLEKQNEQLLKPVNLKDIYAGFYEEEFIPKIEDIGKSLGLGKEANGIYNMTRMEYDLFAKTLKDMGGVNELYKAFLLNKINSTEGEEKKKWQEKLENFRKMQVSPNIEAQRQSWEKLAEMKQTRAMALEKLRYDLKISANNISNAIEKTDYNLARRMFENYFDKIGQLEKTIIGLEQAGAEEDEIRPFREEINLAKEKMSFYENLIETKFKGEKPKELDKDKIMRGIIMNTIRLYRDGKIKSKEEINKKINEAIQKYNYKDIDKINSYTIEAIKLYGIK